MRVEMVRGEVEGGARCMIMSMCMIYNPFGGGGGVKAWR